MFLIYMLNLEHSTVKINVKYQNKHQRYCKYGSKNTNKLELQLEK